MLNISTYSTHHRDMTHFLKPLRISRWIFKFRLSIYAESWEIFYDSKIQYSLIVDMKITPFSNLRGKKG